MRISTRQLTAGFAAFQFGDAVACAWPDGIIKRDLNRLRCPEALQAALPVIKVASGVGLLAGLDRPGLGRLTARCLVGYFGCAIGFHVRAADPWWRFVPAASVGALSLHLATRPV